MSAFDGEDPNGEWKLYAVDDGASDTGYLSGSWQVQIVTSSVFGNGFEDP
jgi:subtilisin-like proprotein convertase family protein